MPPPRSPPFPAATRWNRGNRRCRRPGTPVLLPVPRSLVPPRLVVRQGESEHAAAALARFEEQPPLGVPDDRAAVPKADPPALRLGGEDRRDNTANLAPPR